VALIYWWLPIVAAAVVAAAIAFLVLRRRRTRADATSLPVAHSERLTTLPAYRRALRRYRLLVAGAVTLAVIALVASVTLASRPSVIAISQPELASRDIVLCLDISGSMVDYDSAIVDVFSELATGFTGERIALVLFNASAVTYFPLTSDYAYAGAQLDRLSATFESGDESIYSGTLLGDGSSIIGDGLASCALRFDSPDADRSRSIILATDNVLAGRSIYTLPEAGKLASESGIRVYGINPGDTDARDYLEPLATEFRTVVTSTGGSYYALDDPAAIPGIVDQITAQQATVLPGAPQLVRSDEPGWALLLLLAAVAGLLLVLWRLRR
jgi:hypothetical protein